MHPVIQTKRRSVDLIHQLGMVAALGVALLFAKPSFSIAQPASSSTPVVVGAAPIPTSTPRWLQLTDAQRIALKPLESSWNTLTDGQRRKWIELSKNYASLDTAAQEKLHARMTEWASLSAKDRELARLNYAETKKLAPTERTSTWEAYQALSTEEKQKLVDRASKKQVGAALAVKPTSPQKLTEVPVTRRTPEQAPAVAKFKQSIDRYTLLPINSSEAQPATSSQN